MPRMWNFFILSEMNRLIVILGLLFLCMGNMQADEPVKTGFTHMERSHVRVHTPGLFSKGNSVEIHLECLADSQFCFPLPGGKVISAYGSRGGHSGADIKTKAMILFFVCSTVWCAWPKVTADMER